MKRRDTILRDLHRALDRRRRRRGVLIAGAVVVPLLAGAAVRLGNPPQPDPRPIVSEPATYENIRLVHLEPAGNTAAPLEPTGRVRTISDDELLDALADAGVESGFVRTPDRFVLRTTP